MTPAQQAALEEVVGRVLTSDELTALDDLVSTRKDVEIAAILTAGQPSRLVSVAVEDVFSALYASGDYMTLKTAQLQGSQSAAFAFAVMADAMAIGPGKVDFASAQTTNMLDRLQAEALLSAPGRAALLALATRPAAPIHYNAVSDALNVAEGRLLLGG